MGFNVTMLKNMCHYFKISNKLGHGEIMLPFIQWFVIVSAASTINGVTVTKALNIYWKKYGMWCALNYREKDSIAFFD